MKKILRCCLFVLLSFAFAAAVLPASAAASPGMPKRETVYVNLAPDGNTSGVYVVSTFDMAQAGAVTDYGSFSEVKNMTGTEPLTYGDGVLTANVDAGLFAYEGKMSDTSLPWRFDIDYKLNGVPVKASELAGANGSLELRIGVDAGDARYQNFYNSHALQISYTLDPEKCSNITGETANIVTAGNSVAVSYTILPGAEPSVYTLTTDVRDFEMSAIQIRAVRSQSVSLDTDDFMGQLDDAQDDFQALADAAVTLADGGEQLAAGTADFTQGIDKLYGSAVQLASASAGISSGLGELSGGAAAAVSQTADAAALAQAFAVSEDPQVQGLAQAFLAQTAALESLSEGLGALNAQYATFDAGLQSLPAGIERLENAGTSLSGNTAEYAGGVRKLSDSLGEIPGQLDDMRAQLQQTLDKYAGGEDAPVSFAGSNGTADSVIFIMKTEKIMMPDETPVIEQPIEPVTIWEKLLDLFGLFDA